MPVTSSDQSFDVGAQRTQRCQLRIREVARPVVVSGQRVQLLQPIARPVDRPQQVERVLADLPGVQKVLDQRQAARSRGKPQALGRKV